MNKIPIVNEKDRIIGYKDRKEVTNKEINRVSALWITNSKSEILIAQRSKNKKHDPNKWGVAVAGTVEKGETYHQNIIKEAEEEIRLKNIRPLKGPKVRISTSHEFFCQWYILKTDLPISKFRIRKEEVQAIKWIKKGQLAKELQKNPNRFTASMNNYFKILKKLC